MWSNSTVYEKFILIVNFNIEVIQKFIYIIKHTFGYKILISNRAVICIYEYIYINLQSLRCFLYFVTYQLKVMKI